MADIQNIQLGAGTLYRADYGEGTYSIDPDDYTSLGFTTEKGVSFSYKGDELKIKSGNDRSVKKIFLIGEEASLEAALEELTPAHVAFAMGYAGTVVSNGKFTLGDNDTPTYHTIMFESMLDTNLRAKIVLFKCQAERDVTLELQPDKIVEVPIKLEVLADDAVGDTNGALGWIMIEYSASAP